MSESKTVSSATVLTLASGRKPKTCACGTRFFPLSPRHTVCHACHRAARKVEEKRQAGLRAAAERRAEQQATNVALKEAYFAGTLPQSAKVHRNGRQVAVAWMGRSVTFHLAA